MTKTTQTNECINAKPANIQIEISKQDFKKAIKAHKRFCLIGKKAEGTSFGSLKFTTDKEKLYIESTDGNSALISELDVITNFGESGTFVISADLVTKLALHKRNQDVLQICEKDDSVLFIDVETYSMQEILKSKLVNFPDLEKITPKDNTFKVKLTTTQIKDISAIASKTGFIDFIFNPNNPGAVILIETEQTELTQSALILPWKETSIQKDF